MNKIYASFAMIIILSGCAEKEQTFGSQLQLRADKVHQIGENWAHGDDLITSGHELRTAGDADVKKGEELIAAGNAKITQASQMVREGKTLEAEAEDSYSEKNRHPVLKSKK